MKAVLFPGSRQVDVVELPDPVPGAGEALVRMRASALCRSDMSLYDGTPIVGGDVAGTGNIVPGHEPAGEIAALGPGVGSTLAVGTRVAVNLAIGCGTCRWCQRGYRMLCAEFKCVGFDVGGGNAEYLVVPAVNCMPIPDEMSFEVAAVSTDMMGTQYSTQMRLGVSGVDTVVMSGIGPMGAAGIVAKARGARVIAVDVLDSRLEMARGLGADELVDASDGDAVEQLRELTAGEGIDVGVECSGSPDAQNNLLDAARRFGRVAFIGESRETTINPSDQLIRKMLTVIGGWYFAAWEYADVAALIVERKLPVEKLITHRFELDDAAEAFRAFHARETEKAIFTA